MNNKNNKNKKVYLGKPVDRFSGYGNQVTGQLIVINDRVYLLPKDEEERTIIGPLTGNTVTRFIEVDEDSLSEM